MEFRVASASLKLLNRILTSDSFCRFRNKIGLLATKLSCSQKS